MHTRCHYCVTEGGTDHESQGWEPPRATTAYLPCRHAGHRRRGNDSVDTGTPGATRWRDGAWTHFVHRRTRPDLLMTSTNHTANQMSYRLICHMLRGVLRDHAESGEVDSPECRAVAALYTLLLTHPIDRRGRCLSCRRAGMVFRRRRPCRIYRVAHYWLHRSTALLVSSLAGELGLTVAPLPVREPGIEAAQTDPHTPDHQAPALSSPMPASGSDVPGPSWPDSDHGGAGVPPNRPRSRRGPPDAPSPDPGASVLVTGGALCLV
jgi:hypothetical protein